MCGCEWNYTCSKCAGTPAEPSWHELPEAWEERLGDGGEYIERFIPNLADFEATDAA